MSLLRLHWEIRPVHGSRSLARNASTASRPFSIPIESLSRDTFPVASQQLPPSGKRPASPANKGDAIGEDLAELDKQLDLSIASFVDMNPPWSLCFPQCPPS